MSAPDSSTDIIQFLVVARVSGASTRPGMASGSSLASRCSPLRDGRKAQNEVRTGDRCCNFTILTLYADDFRSAMHQANGAIKSLLLLSRQHSYSHPNSSAASPSTSPSTSTLPNPATATDAELSRARIENMAKLITLLQRNLRVRYELDVGEVVHALAFACSYARSLI